MTINLDELEAVARAATPGPWRAAVVSKYTDADGLDRGKGGIYPGEKPGPPPNFVTHDWLAVDAEHIAAFDPPTALALIAELRRARECIEKVQAVPNKFEWDVPPTAKAILATYDQEGAS